MENNPLEKLVNFSNGITTARAYNGSQLVRCDVVSGRCCRLASKPQDCCLCTPITAAVTRTLEPSDLMLTCCLSAANGWLVFRPTNSLAPHHCCCCCWQGVTRQPSARSYSRLYPTPQHVLARGRHTRRCSAGGSSNDATFRCQRCSNLCSVVAIFGMVNKLYSAMGG